MTLPAPYYADAHVTLYHGDCLALLPHVGEVDHVLTDPPYEAEAHTLGRRAAVGTRPNHAVASWRDTAGVTEAPLPFPPIDAETRAAVASEIARSAKRWALVFCQVEAAMAWRDALLASGRLNYRRTCVWIKPDGQPQLSGDRPGMGYESIVACHVKGRSVWNGGGKLGVFSHVKNVYGSREAAPHPTTKPLALMRELVSLFTDPGDVILDPFAGSGTTGLAARLEGRRAILIEREERYCEVAAKRLAHMPNERANGQLALLGGT